MDIKKFILLIFLTAIFNEVSAQYTTDLNSFTSGEYLAVKSKYSILRAEPHSNALVVDTILDSYRSLSFVVLNENPINNYIKVKVVMREGSLDKPDPETGLFCLPSLIDNGKEGWILSNELMKYPVPELFTMGAYEYNKEILLSIINNVQWHFYYNKKDYPKYKSIKAICYLLLGKDYYEKDSAKKAIFYLTKSIQILPKNMAYKIRALAKTNLQDYRGAIDDCTKGILLEINPPKVGVYDIGYMNYQDFKYENINSWGIRGFSYLQINNYNSAILDFNKAILKDKNDGMLYYYRGFAKFNIGQKESGCKDLSKAGELGIEDAYEIIKENCNN